MTQNFAEVMTSRSNAELLEIVTKLKEDYQPEAVQAAEAEIEKRNLSQDQIKAAEVEISENETLNINKAHEPLGLRQKILFLFFFWGVLPWAMAGTFKAKGYTKKYKDAWKFMKIGILVFWGIPLLLIFVLSLFS